MFNFGNDPVKRKVRLLKEAENHLIDGEMVLDNAKAYVAAAKSRIARLKGELGQCAPTKVRESVTIGDITQGSIGYNEGTTSASPAVQGASIADINKGLSRHFRRHS
jgi:hypothetical protein